MKDNVIPADNPEDPELRKPKGGVHADVSLETAESILEPKPKIDFGEKVQEAIEKATQADHMG